MSNRMGPKMCKALSIIKGCSGSMARIDLAQRVGPNGSLKYGYEIVNRLIATGYVITGRAVEGGRRGLLLAALHGNEPLSA